MDRGILLGYFAARVDLMLDFAKRLVEHESPSLDKAAIDGFASWLAGVYGKLGAEVEVLNSRTHGNSLRITFGAGNTQALILCHMDTVWPVGEIERRPFRVENGQVYGPGIYDMKAGFLYTAEVFAAFNHFRAEPQHRIVLICNSDEEIGSPSSRELIEAEARKSEYVLVLEPSVRGGGLKTARKGQGTYHINVEGIPAHSGSDPERGVSAVQELALHTVALHALTDFASGITVNVGVVKGGSRPNVVASHAEADIDVRVVDGDQMDRIDSIIRSLKPTRDGIKIEVTGGMVRPPMVRTEKTARLFQKAKELAGDLGFELTESSTGAGSDGNFTASVGTPTLDGLGAVGDGSHALHEHMSVGPLAQRIALLYRILTEL